MSEKTENNGDSTVIKPHRLNEENRSTHIWVDNGDKMLIKAYSLPLKRTMTATLHYLIGIGMRSLEEKHLETIASLNNKVHIQKIFLDRYLKLYGKLPTRTKKES